MLMEGVPPAMIENTAKMAGMPVGPLSLSDEVALDLVLKIMKATEADLGAECDRPDPEELLVEDGRKARPLRPQERQGLLRLSARTGQKEPVGRLCAVCSRSTSIPTRSMSRR